MFLFLFLQYFEFWDFGFCDFGILGFWLLGFWDFHTVCMNIAFEYDFMVLTCIQWGVYLLLVCGLSAFCLVPGWCFWVVGC